MSGALRSDLATFCRASDSTADRAAYARDLWPRQQIVTRAGTAMPSPPAVVVWPESTQDVQAILRFASERQIPVVPFGAGSGVCGGILPSDETIVLDTKKMRAVSIDRDASEVTAQSGIIGQHLEDALAQAGLTLGHFPSSIYCSTLGGWIAARSAGQCSGRYGKIEDMVKRLTVVDGTGALHHGERGGENAALLPLFIGSEGILGVVTEASLAIAEVRGRAFASFMCPSTDAGLTAIRRIYQAGLRPAVARLYDPFDSVIAKRLGHKSSGPSERTGPSLAKRLVVRAIRKPQLLNELISRAPDKMLGGAKLVFMWEGEPSLIAAEREEVQAICADVRATDTGEEPARYWFKNRHKVSYRQSPYFAAGAFIDTMEVASTWSRLMPMYRAVREALAGHVFVMAHFSHAYPDGASIYFTFVGSAESDEEALREYDKTWASALAAVVRAGGTLSHHHGVGRSKAPQMRAEQGHALEMVRALKRVMDPAGILNRGSLIPEPSR